MRGDARAALIAVSVLFVTPITLVPRPAAAAGAAIGAEAGAGHEPSIAWQDWSEALFERAKREGRLVLLDLGAVWCHWCHVMEETTYRDPEVVRLIGAHFVAVTVDQDARPDLSNRYEDYGWPATVIFAADGSELVKFQGYIPPLRMASLLQGVVDDPTPGPSVLLARRLALDDAGSGSDDGLFPEALLRELRELLVSRYDNQHGGWGLVHKFLDWDAVEYSLRRARSGEEGADRRARETLAKQLTLIDPVWGGVYQYSHGGVWENPHFEKIMAMQAENLRVYALAYAQWGQAAHLEAARDVERFLAGFLTGPDGVFYTSMDADVVRGEHSGEYFTLGDGERRRLGLPRVDTHLYARENAWAAHALVSLYAVTGEKGLLDKAERVGRWLLAERALPGGGFRHDARDVAGPYLGDNAAALRLFTALYAASADRTWLDRARATADFVERTFQAQGAAGFVTAAAPQHAAFKPVPQRDENIALARAANLLFHYTGEARYRRMAEHAGRHLAMPDVAKRAQTGGVLLVADELSSEPLHLTVVGPRDAVASRELLLAALAVPEAYKRVEMWDRRDGPLPRADVTYPELKRPAAFVCTASRCSAPAFTPQELKARIERAQRSAAAAAR